MVRYARANNFHKHKDVATPWNQLSGRGADSGQDGDQAGSSTSSKPPDRFHDNSKQPNTNREDRRRDNLRGTNPNPNPNSAAIKKPNRKKKEYDDQDVNGFMEFLQQTGQTIYEGYGGGGGMDRGTGMGAFNGPKSGKMEGKGGQIEGGRGRGGGRMGGGREDLRGVREEVETALKKDRRREDRRIKRQDNKKSNMLCFKCRKPGHGVSECPEAEGDEEMGTDICYRCGSTEHEITRCRAKIDPALGDFPYAKCFICGQSGHLSRSCPDNPKGMYAAGGCCRVCGSVEHFQRDCPEHQAATNSVTVPWMSNNMSADHQDVHLPVKKTKPPQPKVVKF